jgi:hypothetical protein
MAVEFDFEHDLIPPLSAGFSWMYAFLMLVNLCLNTTLVYAAWRGKMLTNAANILIVNLAIADLGVAILNFPIWLSNAIAQRWVFGSVGCFISGASTSYFVFNTVFTLFITTGERYLSIVRKKKVESAIVVKVLAGGGWVFGMAYSFLPYVPGGSGFIVQPSRTYCTTDWASLLAVNQVLKVIICTMISSTMLIMIGAYWKIISVFRESQTNAMASSAPKSGSSTSNKLPTSSEENKNAKTALSGSNSEAVKALASPDHGGAGTFAAPDSSFSMVQSLLSRGLRSLNSSLSSTTGILKQDKNGDSNSTSGVEAKGKGLGSSAGTTAENSANGTQPVASQSINTRTRRSGSIIATTIVRAAALSRTLSGGAAHLSPAAKAARKNEKILLTRAVAVVGAFLLCWGMYLFIWILTWITQEPVPVLVDCISALLVALIGVMNPFLTFALDKRFTVIARRVLGIPEKAKEATPLTQNGDGKEAGRRSDAKA